MTWRMLLQWQRKLESCEDLLMEQMAYGTVARRSALN